VSDSLDPQVAALLEEFKSNSTRQVASATARAPQEELIARRQALNSRTALLGGPAEPVEGTTDFKIPGTGGEIPVRLYVPRTNDPSQTRAPVLVYYHGGGFVAGGLESHDTLLRALANRAQCLIVSVAYRLAPEHPFPAANDDAWAAVQWVCDHASEIGGDSQRLAVGGDSAGGLLAARVAQEAAKLGPRLRLQMLLYPNLDATTSKASWRELGSGDYLVSLAQMVENFDAYLPNGINRGDPKVSPLFATDLGDIAPAVIITADHDPLRDEGDEYATKLQTARIPVIHTCWPGMVHGFASMAGVLDAGKQVIEQAASALRTAFA
jgi:acetyl esterase